jgi:hypothetical protein
MFDSHGNPLEIQDMPFAERMAVAGFEFVQDFTDVKKANGQKESHGDWVHEEVQDRGPAQVRHDLRQDDGAISRMSHRKPMMRRSPTWWLTSEISILNHTRA